jgi:hypothetical protein
LAGWWIKRPTIEPAIGTIAARLHKALGAVVAGLAVKRTEPEFVGVAMVRLDVVADRRWLDDAALQEIFTKRAFEQLVSPDPRPPL